MPDSYPVNVRCKGRLTFPALCPKCLAAANSPLPIERAFEKSGGEDGSVTWTIVRYDPLFCAGCIAEHWQQVQPVPRSRRIELMLKTWYTAGIVGGLAVGTFFSLYALSKLIGGDTAAAVVTGLIALLLVLISVYFAVSAYSATRHLALVPESAITAAVRFSDDLSSTFEPSWRRFDFAHEDYGRAFADQNRAMLWDRHGSDARRAQSIRFQLQIVGYIAVGLLVIYWLYDDYLRPTLRAFGLL